MTLPVVFTANGPSGYNLTNSLRFRSSASAYLNRTISSNGSATTFTYSTWVKRGTLGAAQDFGIQARIDGSNNIEMRFDSADTLSFLAFNGGSFVLNFVTTQVFRDPSAWYHIIIAVDTTQATSTNRVKIYVNGSQITAFSTATYPSLNATTYMSQTSATHNIGRWPSPTQYFDGYLDEINFIDGQALTPTSFGSTNALTGVWQPAKYTGTYGTNGFYLPFTDNSALTTSSNVGLGRDYSGNGNYWTTNNISITAGTTYDSMTDVPTLTNATTANYCVLNPLDDNPSLVLSNGNLNGSIGSASWVKVRATFGMPTGKWYFEYTPTSADSHSVGIMRASDSLSGILGAGSFEYGYWQAGYVYAEGSLIAAATYTTNDVIGITFDAATREVKFYKNNTLQVTDTVASTDVYFPTLSVNAGNGAMNFGQRPFAYTPPTGFVALNTFNLPTSTIVKGNTVMDATLYTGTNATLSVANTAGFRPDLVWLKTRSVSSRNTLFDSIRGITKVLWSDSTDAEGTANTGTGLTAFASNGFTLGTEITGTSGSTNTSGATYVGWQWKANGTGVSNTAGSITSTVSANASAGFSVVTYTGNNTSGATVGHGLGVVPAMVICKNRTAGIGSGAWPVWHKSLTGGTYYLFLNTTAAQSNSNNNFTALPTSTVLNLGTSDTNNTATMVAYCFAQIAGYSAFGSYTGNGSADGTFVYTGFRPRFVMIKASSFAGESWYMFDSSRSTYNVVGDFLVANQSLQEINFSSLDFLSNGFKLRTTNSLGNTSGATYIYMAFAENPFKNALAR